MGLLDRIFARQRPRAALAPLYRAVVAEARQPAWYAVAGVPDTVDGRFDMVATVLALTLIRLEREGETGRGEAALLAELFVDDMDGQLREEGIGDIVVGKHVGRMMSMLGGRLTAFRDALAEGGDASAAVRRNLHRGVEAAPETVAIAVARLQALDERLAQTPHASLLAGQIGA